MAKKRPGSVVAELTAAFMARRDDAQAVHLMRFFKTAPGQYGEGDRFLGIKAPVTRSLIKPYRDQAAPADCDALVASEWHEIRLAGFLLMVELANRFAKRGDVEGVRGIAKLYDQRIERANNWDLVDLSAKDVMGAYWRCSGESAKERRRVLRRWAESGNLWREHASVLATWALQRMGSLDETFWLAEFFIDHPHDLMHKACGWMLREAGKRDIGALRGFLARFHDRLPRTALRYAVERMDPGERRRWMGKRRSDIVP